MIDLEPSPHSLEIEQLSGKATVRSEDKEKVKALVIFIAADWQMPFLKPQRFMRHDSEGGNQNSVQCCNRIISCNFEKRS